MDQFFPYSPRTLSQELALEVTNLRVVHRVTHRQYGPISFSVRKGEILGFGGLLGSGRTEILQALCGDEKYIVSGDIKIFGVAVPITQNLQNTFQNGFAFVSEDRKEFSLLPTRSLKENVGILRLNLRKLMSFLSDKSETEKANEDLKKLKTRFHNVQQLITELSGGNQQKVIFARAMQNNPRIIILDEPTRGVDVGAKYEIYQLLMEWAAKGLTILMVSSDMPELMGMSDRVCVMAHGKIQKEFLREEFNQENILKYALMSQGEVI